MINWERARTEKQKELRIREILDATARLFLKNRYEEITLAMIAREANFTRSNLYKYFNTKEEVFLALLTEDLKNLSRKLADEFAGKKKISINKFSSIWTNMMFRYKRTMQLIALSAAILEKNVSDESLINYKRRTMQVSRDLGGLMMSLFPQLKRDRAEDFIIFQVSLASGLYPLTTLREDQKETIEKAGIAFHYIDFVALFERSIKYYLEGLLK